MRPRLGFGFRLGFGWCLGDLGADRTQRGAQRCRVVGGEEFTAGFLGDAGQRRGIRACTEAKAHDMGSERNAGTCQRCSQGAGIAVTTFQPVRDKQNRCRAVTEGKRLGCLLDRIGQRRLAGRRDARDMIKERRAVQRGGRQDHLDIAAITAAAVTIGHQADIGVGVQFGGQVADRVACNLDLGGAVNLAPHRI